MRIVHNLEKWGDAHHPKILDLIRMLLGVFLVLKGSVFLMKYAFLRSMLLETGAISHSPDFITFLIFYITYVHLVGGMLIFLGLFTRVAALLQLPIVFGAVFFVNILSSFINSELWLSILAMALLVLYMVIGSGPLSIDHFISGFRFKKSRTS
jgi:putative oxidoreductase